VYRNAQQTTNLQDEVRFLGGALNTNVAGVCRIRTRARGARRTNLRSVPGSIPGSDTVMLDAVDGGTTGREVSHDQARLRRAVLFFEPMSKRRRGFPSETKVKRGTRIVHGDKLLEEKLGRNDLCPCGSGKRFKRCCLKSGRF